MSWGTIWQAKFALTILMRLAFPPSRIRFSKLADKIVGTDLLPHPLACRYAKTDDGRDT